MSGLIHSEGRTDFAQGNGKSYVSTKPFHLEFYTYTVTENASFQPVGALSMVTGADAIKCPAGRVLHLTGRKLYPGVNPNVSKFMVSVYDPITFFTGFIDPSSSTFAKYDQNLPSFFDNGGSIPPLGGQAGKLTLNDVANLASVAVGGTVNAKDSSVGQVTITGAAGTTTIQTTACRAGSRIIVTPVGSAVTQLVTQSATVTFTVPSGGGSGAGDLSEGVQTTLTVYAASGSNTLTATAGVSLRVPMDYYVSEGVDAAGATPAYFTITTVGASLSGAPTFNWLVIN